MSFIKTVLLNAFPAGGKSEIRTLLRHEHSLSKELMVGEQVQLDDYPYVKFMRDIDDSLAALGHNRFFFELPDRGFRTGVEWGVLTLLVNEDYKDLMAAATAPQFAVKQPARWLLQRYDRARTALNLPTLLGDLPAKVIWGVESAIESAAAEFVHAKYSAIPKSMEGKTVFIEFSRGGPHGSSFPLPDPHGYQYTWGLLSDEILAGAAVLYVSVTAEQSRAKNIARGKESLSTSVSSAEAGKYVLSLNHSVPDHVMFNEYGCDDLHYLMSISGIPSAVKVPCRSSGKEYVVPVALFDNTKDYTTFCRGNPSNWKPEDKAAIVGQLKIAFEGLVKNYRQLHP